MAKKSQSKQVGFTINELARNFDRTEASIRHLSKTLVPIGKRGKASLYDHTQIDALLKKTVSTSRKSEDTKSLEERKLDLQCQKLQIEIDEKLGKLIPSDEVRRFIATHTSAVTGHLRRQPGELAPLLEGLSVARIEKKLITSGEELIAKLRAMPVDD